MLDKIKRNPDAVLAIAIAIVLPIIFEGDSKIWVAVSFGVFILAFGRKIWGAVVGKLDERAISIQDEINEAHRLREEAQTLLADYEARRIEAETDARDGSEVTCRSDRTDCRHTTHGSTEKSTVGRASISSY